MEQIVEQYNELIKIIGEKNTFSLSTSEKLHFQDVLELLIERKYILDIELDNCNVYKIVAPLDDFKNWLDIQVKESRRLNSREWKIAIISAISGAVVSTIISWLLKLI